MSIITPNNSGLTSQQLHEQEKMKEFAKMIKSASDMNCEKCQCSTFINVHKIKVISGLATGTGTDMIVPISVYACADCGNINEYFLAKIGGGEIQ